MNFSEYIKPELLVLVPVLYLIGNVLKGSKLPNKWIPITLGVIGVLLVSVYSLAKHDINNYQTFLMLIFTSITQGILVAGTSVYANQIIKQAKKVE